MTSYYLLLEDVDGNSAAAGYETWFDVSAFDIGATLALLGGSGSGSSKPQFQELSVTLESVSPALLALLASGEFLGAARLVGVDETGHVEYDLRLGELVLTSITTSGSGGGQAASTRLSIDYGKIGLITDEGSAGFDRGLNVTIDPLDITPPTPNSTGGAQTDAITQYYLAIDDVDGGGTAAGFENWFEVLSVSFGVANPSSIGSVGGGAGAGKAFFQDLQVMLGSLSPELFAKLATGEHIEGVTLVGVDAAGEVLYELRLGDVTISSDQLGASLGGPTTTSLSFAYAQIGVVTPDETFGYNVSTNLPIDPDTIEAPTVSTTGGPQSEMVDRYFLLINGFDGGSTAVGHEGWFEIFAVTLGASHPGSSGGGGAGKAAFSDLSVVLAGLSPALLAQLSQGTFLDSVRVEGINTSGEVVYEVRLGEVLVSSASLQGVSHAGIAPVSNLSFNYAQIGVTTPEESFGFDLNSNSEISGAIDSGDVGSTGGAEDGAVTTYYMLVHGIDGGSTAVGHEGWFELSSLSLGVSHSGSAVGSGGGAGKTNFSDLNVLIEGISPELLLKLAGGANIPALKIEGVSALGDVVYDLRLGNVTVSSALSGGAGGGSVPTTALSFTYDAIGIITEDESFGFSLSTNGTIDPTTIAPPAVDLSGGAETDAVAQFYLVIDGLDGSSTAAGHVGAFNLGAIDFSLFMQSGTSGGAGGAGKVDFSDLTLIFEGISPALLDALATGLHVESMRIEGVTASGIVAYDLRLGDVTVSSLAMSGAQGSSLFNSMSVQFATFGLITTEESFGFDIAANDDINPLSIPLAVPGSVDGADPAQIQKYYLLIEDIDGTSTAIGFEAWFEITSFSLSGAYFAGTSGGAGGAGKADFGDLHFSMNDVSPALLAELVRGTSIGAVKIKGVTSAGDVALEVRLAEVNVVVDSTAGFDSADAASSVSLHYRQIGVFSPGGSFGFDLGTNTSIDPNTIPDPEADPDPVNTPPSVVALTGNAGEDGPHSANLLLNASDADAGDTLSVVNLDTSVTSTGGRILTLGTHYELNGATLSMTSMGLALFNNLALGASDVVTFDFGVTDSNATTPNTYTLTVNGANDAATFGGAKAGSVAEEGVILASGALTVADADAGQSGFQTPASLGGIYGGFTFNTSNGAWTYTLNNAAANVQALAPGQVVHDVLTVKSTDGTTTTIDVTINGANDAATFGGAKTGSVTEDGTLFASGTLSVNDIDFGQNGFQTPASLGGNYGAFTFLNGAWTYTLNNNHAAVQALNAGQTLTDTLTVKAIDGTVQLVTITINGANDGVTINGTSRSDIISPLLNTVSGQPRPTIFGDTLYGNAGDDYLDGGAGGDRMFGGKGNDLYYVDSTADVVTENADEGIDTVIASANFVSAGNLEIILLAGGALNATGDNGANGITGTGAANILNGLGGIDIILAGGGADTVYGGDGNDVIEGGDGADTLYGDANNDLIDGGRGDDRVFGGDGKDTLRGGDGADTLDGGAADDTLDGGKGADRLIGGAGKDTLTGGADADTFVFNAALGASNIDRINDFKPKTDKIELDDAIFTAMGVKLDASEFRIGGAALDADDRIIYNSSNGKLLYDADGAGGAAAIEFAVLGTGLALTAADFTIG